MKKSNSHDSINKLLNSPQNVRKFNFAISHDHDRNESDTETESPGPLPNLASAFIHHPNSSRRISADNVLFKKPSHPIKRVMSSIEFHQNVVDNSCRFSQHLEHDQEQFITNKFESLDYEKIANLIDVNDEPLSFRLLSRKQLARWLVMFLVGICTGIIAVIVDIIVENLTKFKYRLISSRIRDCTSNHCLWQPLLIWIGFNVFLSSIGCLLIVCFAPEARASGLPSVKGYLNGINVPKVVRLKTLLAKMFGVSICIPGGLSWGKEGPMIHSGAIVAAGLSQGFSPTLGIDLGIFKYFRNDKEKRDFVSGGAAAGVAAAFGAPIGGMLFSLEEGASFWNQSLTWRIFFCSMISTFTLNVLLSFVNGNFGDLSNPSLTDLGKFTNITYKWYELPIFLLMGAFGGVIGAVFNHFNTKLMKFRKNYVKSKLSNLTECILLAATSAIIGFSLSMNSSDCQSTHKVEGKHNLKFFCDEGEYNVMAGLFFQTPEKSVESMFHDPLGSHHILTLVLFFIVTYISVIWTYGMAVPSGVFVPSILIGSIWGRLFGIFTEKLFPGTNLDPRKYALIGAASTLAGILRMTVSLSVILIEATGDITLGLPIMFSISLAKIVGDLINEGLLEMHMDLASLPFLNWSPPPGTEKLNVQHVMTHPVVVINEVDSVGRIVDILKKTTHNGFPVVRNYNTNIANQERFGELRGLILRHQLVTLLKHKCFMGSEIRLKPDDFQVFYPRYLRIDQIKVDEHDKACKLDLTPYLNFSPYSLGENSNFPRVFRLFRGLGLRHLIIVDDNNYVVGIVTRIDIARYKTHIRWTNASVHELDVVA